MQKIIISLEREITIMCENCKNFEPKVSEHKNMTEIRELIWQDAVDWATALGEDWVLPNRWQLVIMYRAKELGHPDLQDMRGWFWASSIAVANSNIVWSVCFYNGDIDVQDKVRIFSARCVRRSFLDSLTLWVLKNDKD